MSSPATKGGWTTNIGSGSIIRHARLHPSSCRVGTNTAKELTDKSWRWSGRVIVLPNGIIVLARLVCSASITLGDRFLARQIPYRRRWAGALLQKAPGESTPCSTTSVWPWITVNRSTIPILARLWNVANRPSRISHANLLSKLTYQRSLPPSIHQQLLEGDAPVMQTLD